MPKTLPVQAKADTPDGGQDHEIATREAPSSLEGVRFEMNDDGELETVLPEPKEDVAKADTSETTETESTPTPAENYEERFKGLEQLTSKQANELNRAKEIIEHQQNLILQMQTARQNPPVNQDGTVPGLDLESIWSDPVKAVSFIASIAKGVYEQHPNTKQTQETLGKLEPTVGEMNAVMDAVRLSGKYPDFKLYKGEIEKLRAGFPGLSYEDAYAKAKDIVGPKGEGGSKIAATTEVKVSPGLSAEQIRQRAAGANAQRTKGADMSGNGRPAQKKVNSVADAFWAAVEEHS